VDMDMDENSRQVNWSEIQPFKRVWLSEAGGDQDARLEFLAEQGLRLVMADVSAEGGETLHFFNPLDEETIHLACGPGAGLLAESSRYFPEARRWRELVEGGEMEPEKGPEGLCLARGGLLLRVIGSRVRGVYEAAREYPQAAMYGKRAREAGLALEGSGGLEGLARGMAFVQALEDARGVRVPEAALALRAALLEISRVLYHLAWICGACRPLGRPGVAERCSSLLMRLGRMMEDWLGDPLGRGWIVPGGVREDFPVEGIPGAVEGLASAEESWEEFSPAVLSLPVPGWVSRRARAGAAEAGSGGWVGPLARAAGLNRDTRLEEPGVYAAVGWKAGEPPRGKGLLRRMVEVRVSEVSASLALAGRVLKYIPPGKLLVKRGKGGRGEGFGRCEGPDGEICCHLVTGRGRVAGMSLSLPRELNRSAARFLEGAWVDEVEVLSLLWESPHQAGGSRPA